MVVTLYVQASLLNLRGAPAPDAPLIGRLDVNTPVAVLATEGTFAKVRVGNGREGWVDRGFLAEAPLTVEAALARARAAATPAERLSWAQRAAAIRSDDATLAALEEAYRAAGDPTRADQIARERRWPHQVKLALDGRLAVGGRRSRSRRASRCGGSPPLTSSGPTWASIRPAPGGSCRTAAPRCARS